MTRTPKAARANVPAATEAVVTPGSARPEKEPSRIPRTTSRAPIARIANFISSRNEGTSASKGRSTRSRLSPWATRPPRRSTWITRGACSSLRAAVPSNISTFVREERPAKPLLTTDFIATPSNKTCNEPLFALIINRTKVRVNDFSNICSTGVPHGRRRGQEH